MGADTIFANSASYITCCNDTGSYEIRGLPPGEYSIEVRDLGTTATQNSPPGYSDPVRTDNNLLTQSNTVIGAFPGDVEFYNGANESNDPAIDDPTQHTTVTISADSTLTGIEITFNRDASIKGSSLGEVYILPKMLTADGEDTSIAIVNPNSEGSTVEVFGFTAAGDVISSAIVSSLPALGKAWFTVKEAFPDDFSRVAWVQVGSSHSAYVFAELTNGTTHSAYLANRGLASNAIMPHVAKDTASFQTVIASVNGSAESATVNLVAEPDKTSGALSDLGTAYNQADRDLRDVFGNDLTAIDWVRLESSISGTASMEYFTTQEGMSQRAALGLNSDSGKTLRFLHIAADTARFWTGLVYINISDETVTVTETFYGADGSVIGTNDETLAAGQKVTLLYDANNQVRVPAGSAWMKVEVPDSSNAQLVGYELFGSPNPAIQDIFAGLQGNYTDGSAIDFPHFNTTDIWFTGLVATNLGTETADLTLQAIGADGTVLETKNRREYCPQPEDCTAGG